MSTNQLLAEFPPVSTEAWEQVIREELRGADYAKKLVWNAENGLTIKPYYRNSDCEGSTSRETVAGEYPYLRGARAEADWVILEAVCETEPRAANEAARNALGAGADEIEFRDVQIRGTWELEILLAGLHETKVHFQAAHEALHFLLRTSETTFVGSGGFCPFNNLEYAADVLAGSQSHMIPFRLDGGAFAEAGATICQEIGYALAAAADFFAEMQSRQISIDRSAESLLFSFSIGSNFFFEIAKLRAFRLLYARMVESFAGSPESARAVIHARTSRWNTTIYNPYANIMRATTETMSAILGGADSILVAPFDDCFQFPNEESRRLARNTQLLLKKEAQLARVADPGGGSYYLETLTDSIAAKTWNILQQIEAVGGYRKAQAAGEIKRAIERSRTEKERAVASRNMVLVGTNKYPSLTERMLPQLDPDRAPNPGDFRAAAIFEKLRLRTERYAERNGKSPAIQLAEIGDRKMRATRASFAANIFGCAGFAIDTRAFNDIDSVADCAADLIVLCSSDVEYLEFGPRLLATLKDRGSKTPVIIAGTPDTKDQLLAAGVADFLHIHSNPIEFLSKWQQRLGVLES